MIRFHSCRKCGGDLMFEYDQYGKYWSCLQCGWDEGIIHRFIPVPKIDHRFKDFRRIKYSNYYNKEDENGH
jgi:hypothetical protein